MEGLGAGYGFVQVAAYRIADSYTTTNGKKAYFINQKVNTTSVQFE
jgi:hypothetical protein